MAHRPRDGLKLREMLGTVATRVSSRRADLRLATSVDERLPEAWCDESARLTAALCLLVEHAASVGDDERVSLSVHEAGRSGACRRLRFEVRDHAPQPLVPTTDPIALEGRLTPRLFRRLLAPFTDELGVTRSALRGHAYWFVLALRPAAGVEDPELRPRVLVVDDNRVNRRVASHILEGLGCEVDLADDGCEAVSAHRAGRYSMILMDCQMPIMDGYEATARIRRKEGMRRRTPIVACTSLARSSNRSRCLDIGMDDFVTKPLSGTSLQRVVSQWIPEV